MTTEHTDTPPDVPTSAAPSDREARRRAVERRQLKVLGTVAAVLTVLAFLGALWWAEVLPSPFAREFSREPTGAAAVEVACPPADATPVPLDQVQANVLNGSDVEGQAGRTAEGLAALGVQVQDTANWPETSDVPTLLIAGEGALAQAYTLAQVLPDAIVTTDGRNDPTVDVVLGEDSPLPLSPEAAAQLPADQPFVAPADCS